VVALAACGDVTVRDRLFTLCKDKQGVLSKVSHDFVKQEVAIQLGRMRDQRAKKYLHRLAVHSDNPQVRMQADQLVSELDKVKSN